MSALTDAIDRVSAVRARHPRTPAQELLRLERLLEEKVGVRDRAAIEVVSLRDTIRRLRVGLSFQDATEYHRLLREEFHGGAVAESARADGDRRGA